MDRTAPGGQRDAPGTSELLASTHDVTVETRPDGTLTISARMPLYVNTDDIPAVSIEHELLPEGGWRDRFYLADDAHVDFLVDAHGEVGFSAQNVSMTITRAGVVTFALKNQHGIDTHGEVADDTGG
ncbi:hypothetical protein [Deinococcus aestuarii]|uniref:hypothetical protein n=1 Tax=Deinococcus aestuarii TaxID=2774531 RepID=UPI001C0DC0F1|nr:hypothetical protein [Deinococcus aestuarii]